MNEYNDILRKIAAHTEELDDNDINTLRHLCREYPADAIAPALLLKYAAGSLDEEETAYARARVSLYTGHPQTLITAIDPSGKGFNTFYPPAPSENRPSTANAIDIFLETYGHQSAEEDALLERMIFNPVPSYADQLARETANRSPQPAAGSTQDRLIDAFIATHSPSSEKAEQLEIPEPTEKSITPEKPAPAEKKAKAPQPPTSSLLSQSLAKIFIKQGRYERAYEIISNLSLNYPEKSVYFADQLRFLEKLIINQRYAKGDTHE